MRDWIDIAADLAMEAFERQMDISGDGRVSDRDMCVLLKVSARRARELREAGEAWPRYRASVGGCTYSVSFADAAVWLWDRREG